MILKPKVIACEETRSSLEFVKVITQQSTFVVSTINIHQVRLPSPYTTKAKRTNNIYM
ncbi:hypothetical protein M8C21_017996 [Ambrosia artemisiifolia]|uniref:Uncharacterized protein n=1 Tax=Ambrosia artemisiifolia TaxID=4212 RepID=A0AAD5D7U1_AMBAR|nr:hypothetical protein M8C21_017996 [Ambrosia artemisiifolia]